MGKVYTGTGRRKSSVAQVKMTAGSGKITVNGKDVREFMPYETYVMDEANEGNDDSYRKILKRAGFVTRDSRSKERKKPGLKAARRAPQFSKR